jgi:acyl-CoA synthetase (AMP-forming)/AMP-acid ligase II
VLRGGVGVAAAASLVRLALGVPLHVVRRGGIATAVGIAARRSPDRTVIVRGLDTMTGRELDAAVAATADAMAQRWAPGTRVGVRGDGGIEFLVVLAAAGLAGVEAVAVGPRSGPVDGESVDAWDVVRRGDGFDTRRMRYSTSGAVRLLSTGTTGVPTETRRGRVGVRGMLQLADAARRLRIPEGPMLVLAPPDHGHGLSMVLAGLVGGHPVVLASGMRPAEQAELAARHRVTTISGVPTQLARLLEDGGSATLPEWWGGVRLVVSGSSKLPGALRARLGSRGARVVDCYGSTESGTVAIDGRPLAGVTIEVGGDRGILISSPLGGRRVPPGDAGRIEGGRLIVEGRIGELVDSGGELLSPDRIARTLHSLPGVASARVWTEPDDLLGSRLCAEVHVSDAAVDAAVLARELTARAGRAAVPRELRVVLADSQI